MTHIKVMKQALEVLKAAYVPADLDEQREKAITAIKQVIAQDALDKMAENARELGLSYDDAPKIGCVNHDCDKCKAVQQDEWVGLSDTDLANCDTEEYQTARYWERVLRGKNSAQSAYDQTALELCDVCGWKTLIPDDVCLNCEYEKNAAQPAPVKTYHDGKPWPVAPLPHECQTEAEKTAYAFGWWKAMEYVREHGVIK
jgi:hypothetical protein